MPSAFEADVVREEVVQPDESDKGQNEDPGEARSGGGFFQGTRQFQSLEGPARDKAQNGFRGLRT